jgi:hypothetical protein
MKKTLFLIILIVSVGANLLAAAFFFTRSTIPLRLGKGLHPKASESTGDDFLPPANSSEFGVSLLGPTGDLALTRDLLVAEGYSPKVVGIILTNLVGEKPGYRERSRLLREESKAKGITPEGRRKNEALNQEILQEVSDLFPLTPVINIEEQRLQGYATHYGDLPAETAAKLRELESENRQTTDRRFAEKLPSLLTPGQTEDYLRYNSLLARTIQSTLASIDIDENSYDALLAAAIDREKSPAPDLSPTEAAMRNRSPSSVETYRRILGAEQFLRVISSLDSVSASVDAVYQVANLTPEERADLFIEASTVRYQRYSGVLPRELIPDTACRTYESLTHKAKLTPEQIEGFDRMLGHYLKRGELGPWGMNGVVRGW